MRKVFVIMMMLATVMTVSAQKKWSYKLGFGGDWKSGNVNTTIFNTNAGVERNDSTLAFDASAGYSYGLKEGEMFENNFNGSIKFDVWQYDRWSPFVSAIVNCNPIKMYDYRLNLLVGGKYRIYHTDACDYSISAAYVFEHTQYFKSVEGMTDKVSRISFRFKMRQKITDNLSLKHTTFYQPAVTNWGGDWVVNSVTSLNAQISKNASLGLNFSYEHNELVPAGVEKDDFHTTASLNLKF